MKQKIMFLNMKSIIKRLVSYFLQVNLCNRIKCYRVVTRKNGVCEHCKRK